MKKPAGRFVLALCCAILLAAGLVAAWRFSGLSALVTPANLSDLLSRGRGEPWAILFVVAAFLAGGVVVLPVNILILATAAAFGPWLGILYSAVGAAVSAMALYWVGARFGREGLERLVGARWAGALDGVRRRGVLAVAAIRILPLAPFTIINLAAGASSIAPVDFLVGTALGLGPGLVLLSIVGDRLVAALADPSAGTVALLALAAVVWATLVFGLQGLLSRSRRRNR